LLWQVLGAEMRDHMILPMGLTLLMVLGGTIPSILVLLRPIRRAAAAAETLDVTEATGELDPTGMPAEVAGLTISVNRAFERIRELLQTQRLLTSAISHEIRTPLAIVHLELQRIDHPRARKALLDLDHLVHFVTQLTMLARLEGGRTIVTTPIDLGGLVAHVVEQMAPFVYENGHEIAFAGAATPPVSGNRTLLEDAVRNLIENAVRHTPDGTRITVGVAACQVEVNDNASPPAGLSGLDSEAGHLKPGDGLGIGLKIVRRIMALHGGALHLRHGPQGTEVVLTLQPALS
jgi:signal transduction histidine kinase